MKKLNRFTPILAGCYFAARCRRYLGTVRKPRTREPRKDFFGEMIAIEEKTRSSPFGAGNCQTRPPSRPPASRSASGQAVYALSSRVTAQLKLSVPFRGVYALSFANLGIPSPRSRDRK